MLFENVKKIDFYLIAHILETIVENQLLEVEKYMMEKIDEINNNDLERYNEVNKEEVLTSIVKNNVNELVKKLDENEEINQIIKDTELKFVCYSGLIMNKMSDGRVSCVSKMSININDGSITKVVRNQEFQLFYNLVCIVEN